VQGGTPVEMAPCSQLGTLDGNWTQDFCPSTLTSTPGTAPWQAYRLQPNGTSVPLAAALALACPAGG